MDKLDFYLYKIVCKSILLGFLIGVGVGYMVL